MLYKLSIYYTVLVCLIFPILRFLSSLLVDFDYDGNLFEYEQNSAVPVLKGRLKAKLDYWYTIGTNNFVTDTIRFGYRFLFY